MSDKKQIVDEINRSFTENNTEGFLAHCKEDITWTMTGEKTTTGKDQIREFMASCAGMEPPNFDVKKTIAEGDSVVCYGDMTMKGPDGETGDYSYCDIYHFDGDKVAELITYMVKAKADDKNASASA